MRLGKRAGGSPSSGCSWCSHPTVPLHSMHQPFNEFKSKIVIPWGLTLTAGGAGEAHAHGMAGLWSAATLNDPGDGADFDGGNGHRTGWGSGPTIDQIVA